MKTINMLIALLIVVGILGLSLVEGYIKPGREKQEQQYLLEQKDPLTHDFSRALQYRNQYMGNASNLSNLNASLPLDDIERSIQLYPEILTAEIFFQEAAIFIDRDLLKRSLIYNVTANFVLIDNLEVLSLHFQGETYTANRESIAQWYGMEPEALQDAKRWKKEVQDKLKERSYVERFMEEVFEID